MASGLLISIGRKVLPECVGAEAPGDTQDGRDEEVVEVGAEGPEGDKNCRVDVPRLKLCIHFFAKENANRCSTDCKSEKVIMLFSLCSTSGTL